MSKRQVELAKDFRKYVHERVQFLVQSLPIIVPLTEEDSKKMRIGIDMIQSIDEKLQKAETARDFSEIIDLDDIEDTWPLLKNQLDIRESVSSNVGWVHDEIERYNNECVDDDELPFH